MKIYYIGPVVALAVFGAYAWNFSTSYDAREAEKLALVRQAKEAKLKSESNARRQAIDDAVAAQAKLKKERADKEAAEERKKEGRQAALELRDKTFKEQEKLARQVDRLKRDIKIEQDSIAKLDSSIKAAGSEKEFQEAYVSKAKKNTQAIADILTKMDAADATRAAAAATGTSKS